MFEIQPPEDIQPDLVSAELLGVINKMANSMRGLSSIIKEYEAMVHALREQGGRLVAQRDLARQVAATLEAECASCWGPVHAQRLNRIHKGLDDGS